MPFIAFEYFHKYPERRLEKVILLSFLTAEHIQLTVLETSASDLI